MASTRKRIEIIDVAKAITIFLVILGHTTANTDTVMYRRVLYAFHMPLFFLLAGLSIKPRAVTGAAQWLDFIRENVLALVVPYIVWGLVYAPFEYASFRFLTALVASIIVLPLSMALNAVIERFIPELLGQFPSWPASLRDARARS